MFGPRHTAESVVSQLINGLDEGDIVLRPEEARISSPERIRELTDDRLASLNKRLTLLLFLNVVISLLIAALGGYVAFIAGHRDVEPLSADWKSVLSVILGLLGLLYGLVTRFILAREKRAELKTVNWLVKSGDLQAAQKLAARVITVRIPPKSGLDGRPFSTLGPAASGK